MNKYDNILKSLNELYKGKDFIRISKYGRVSGVVKKIEAIETFIVDEETTEILKGLKTKQINTKKPKNQKEIKYHAFSIKFKVKSTNDILYNFEECYFI
jgi:hypothetical protein